MPKKMALPRPNVKRSRGFRIIPNPAEADSRKGFPHRRGSDSTPQTQGGLPWQLPFCSEETMTPPRFAGWHGRRRTAIRPDGCSRWRRSMTAAVGVMRRRSAVSGCRPFVTGCCGSMPKAPEARVGQKNKIARRWAKRGTRPSAPHDQRARSAHIFGAICPHEGKGAALVLPSCNTAAMNLHLAEISNAVAPGAHAVLVMDQAGWHTSTKLVVPDNITVVSLPPRSPELNPVENVWQFMRDNWLSNRIFTSYEDILDHCCHAWNTLIDQPWKIMSLGRRQWAHRS